MSRAKSNAKMIRELAFIGGFVSLFASGAFARDEPVLARVTVYWPGEGGYQACWNGARLRPGHCAVDPNKIPYGSRVLFPDATCVAVDTGPAVVNRKAARLTGRTQRERNALVIDRFFESKEQALAWERRHPHFMTVRVVSGRAASPSRSRTIEQPQTNTTDVVQATVPQTVPTLPPPPPMPCDKAAATAVALLRNAKPALVSAPPSYHRRRFAANAKEETTVPPPNCRFLPVKRSRVA
jgi:3D (Asp-Asp-Asp) domain-containing protein